MERESERVRAALSTYRYLPETRILLGGAWAVLTEHLTGDIIQSKRPDWVTLALPLAPSEHGRVVSGWERDSEEMQTQGFQCKPTFKLIGTSTYGKQRM